MGKKTPPEERFWRKVLKTETCWMWTGGTSGWFYGSFSYIDGKKIYAHRYSYELANGEIPEGMLVCHSCDNPKCVRPDHLFLGTYQTNIDDREMKKRGNRSPQKLTWEDVFIIRERRKAGESYQSIAKDYDVSGSTIGGISKNKTWKV